MLKSQQVRKSDGLLCMLRAGVYLGSQTKNPQRVVLKTETPVTVVENHDNNFVVVMINSQTFVLAHVDSLEEVS